MLALYGDGCKLSQGLNGPLGLVPQAAQVPARKKGE